MSRFFHHTLPYSVLAVLALCFSTYCQAFDFKTRTLTDELVLPWGMAFLPDGQLLITEKAGQLRVWHNWELSEPVAGVPEVYDAGQGGLLAVVPHPDFARNNWLYLTYAAGDADNNALHLARGRLNFEQGKWLLSGFQELFRVMPSKDTPVHYGGRLVFLPDGTLVLSSGDGFDYRESAQRGDSLLGKMIRLRDDGSVPDDNPFVSDPKYHNAVWSLGHRNPQALVYDPKRNILWENEHGPAGGDEINRIQPGQNYGWPILTNGKDYSGANITPFSDYPGMTAPFVDWTPSIAPSAMTVYYGEMFPEFNGDLLVTTLKSKELRRVQLKGLEVVAQHSLLTGLDTRMRDVLVGPKGAIYLLTDAGELLRIYRD